MSSVFCLLSLSVAERTENSFQSQKDAISGLGKSREKGFFTKPLGVVYYKPQLLSPDLEIQETRSRFRGWSFAFIANPVMVPVLVLAMMLGGQGAVEVAGFAAATPAALDILRRSACWLPPAARCERRGALRSKRGAGAPDISSPSGPAMRVPIELTWGVCQWVGYVRVPRRLGRAGFRLPEGARSSGEQRDALHRCCQTR